MSALRRLRAPELALAGSLVVIAAACSGARPEGLDPRTLPENVQSDYGVFAQRCSKCHSLARPLSSGISDDEQWRLYVNRMRLQPGSGISEDDQEHILAFLRYYAAELRRKEAERKAVPPAPATAPPPDAGPSGKVRGPKGAG